MVVEPFCLHRLFEIAPDLLSLFPFDEVSEETPGLKKHASDVMESIDKAIDLLKAGDLEELQDTLLELGIVHHMKSVQVESFAVSSVHSCLFFVVIDTVSLF